MAALALSDKISQSATGGVKFRIIKSQFGDGYSQRTPDGINNRLESWNLVWDNITEADKFTLVSQFDSIGGSDYVTWTSFNGTVGKWILGEDGYSFSLKGGNIWSVTAQITQVFDL